MSQLINFIKSLFAEYEFEIMNPYLLEQMEHRIELFISIKYPLIVSKRYVKLEADNPTGTINIRIDDGFKDEMKKHYPEFFI